MPRVGLNVRPAYYLSPPIRGDAGRDPRWWASRGAVGGQIGGFMVCFRGVRQMVENPGCCALFGGPKPRLRSDRAVSVAEQGVDFALVHVAGVFGEPRAVQKLRGVGRCG